MADFALLGEAMMMAQGQPPGSFMRLYQANRRDSVARGLEASPVAQALRDFTEAEFEKRRSELVFTGNWKQLLRDLEPYRDNAEAWPKSSEGISRIVRRQRPALAQVGVLITIGGHTKQGTIITVKRVNVDEGDGGDGGDGSLKSISPDVCVTRQVEGEL